MGHIINPVSHRVGLTKFWNSTWAILNKTAYSYLALEDIMLQRYLKLVVAGLSSELFPKNIIISSLKILRLQGRVLILWFTHARVIHSIYHQISHLLGLTRTLIKLRRTKRISTALLFNRGQKSINKNKSGRLLLFNKKLKQNERLFVKASKRTMPYTTEIQVTDLNAYSWNSFMGAKNFKNLVNSKSRPLPVAVHLIEQLLRSRWLTILQWFINRYVQRFFGSVKVSAEMILILNSTKSLTANFVAQYVATRLIQRFPVRKVINNVLVQVKKMQGMAQVLGFKVACSGRFERRGRASYIWKTQGKIGRSSVELDVDYALVLPILINSICAVKIWVVRLRQPSKSAIIY